MKSFAHTKAAALLALAAGVIAHDDGNTVTTLSSTFGTSTFVPPTQVGCPTVTVTGELCTTCAVPACLGLSTVTQSCGCPTAIPTVTLNYPCADNCKGVWCSTSFDIVNHATSCPTSSTVTTTTTAEPTETSTGSTTSAPTTGPPSSSSSSVAPSSTTSVPPIVSVSSGRRRAAPFWRF